MENIKEKILFVKPFEIESSYSFFNMVWAKIKKVFAATKEVSAFALLRSVDAGAKYGFVSISAWDSKEAFANAVNRNIVLKYHISKNGEEKDSDYLYLYKALMSDSVPSGKKGNAYFVEFIKGEGNTKDSVARYWEAVNGKMKENGILRNSYLCKSLYKISGYTFVIVASLNVSSSNALAGKQVKKILGSNISAVMNSYSSFYNKNFKTIIPNKY